MARRIPTSWEDDDWITPSASSAPAAPPVVVTPTQQPKTFYKPELTILRRTPASSSSSTTTLGTPQILRAQSSDQSERERKEKERRERERRYQEAKERIFNEIKQPSKSPSPASSRPGSSTSSPNRGRRKRGDGNENSIAPAASGNDTATRTTTATVTPTIVKPPKSDSGAIVGFSLNSGKFAPAPTRTRQEWQLKQVALDGKMLESQAEAYGLADNQPLEGEEQGLDWDEFRRDTPGRDVEDRLAGLDIGSREASVGKETKSEGDGGRGIIVGQPVREPKGPEEGKGFGRGRGRRQA